MQIQFFRFGGDVFKASLVLRERFKVQGICQRLNSHLKCFFCLYNFRLLKTFVKST